MDWSKMKNILLIIIFCSVGLFADPADQSNIPSGKILIAIENGVIPSIADYISFQDAKRLNPHLDIPTESLWADSVKANIQSFQFAFPSSIEKPILRKKNDPEVVRDSDGYVITKHGYDVIVKNEQKGAVFIVLFKHASLDEKLISIRFHSNEQN